jgi:hypothetical protein
MFCHKKEEESLFVCKSSFIHRQEEEEVIPDPETKSKQPKYLPGEKLLIKLGKERKKQKKKVDVDKISRSLSRVLNEFIR